MHDARGSQRANGERSAQGIPINTTDATGADGNAGQFGFDHWQMQLDPTALSESYPGATAAEKVP